MAVEAKEVFRDHEVSGIPASGEHEPIKSEIRELFDQYDASIGDLAESIEVAAEGTVLMPTWAALNAVAGTRAGQPGAVPITDTGTHTDPVVGGTVPNSGSYSWSTAPTGWRRVGAYLGATGDKPKLALNGLAPNESFIYAQRGDRLIARGFRWKSTQAVIMGANEYPTFNLTSDDIDGVSFRDMNDDVAPYFVNGGHQGGQHQFYGGRMTAVLHGKDTTDIGSIWTNDGGTTEFVIIRVLGVNQVLMAQRGSDVVPPSGTYTHVDGAPHTGNIVVTASELQLWGPMISDHNISVAVDGQPVTEESIVTEYSRNVTFTETYGVMAREDVIDWFIANGDSGLFNISGPLLFSVSIVYQFDVDGNLTIYNEWIARTAGFNISYFYGLQAALAGADEFYIPKTTSFVHDGIARNYSLIYSAAAPTTEVILNTGNTVAGGLFLDRIISMDSDYGLAMGFTPIQDEEPANRRANMVTGANTGMSIATSGKLYARALNKGVHAAVLNEKYNWISYRNIIERGDDRTSLTTVRTNKADFVYADWHDCALTDERIPIPPDLVGKTFTVVEKSANVTVLSSELNGTLLVSVAATGSYAYLVLQVNK